MAVGLVGSSKHTCKLIPSKGQGKDSCPYCTGGAIASANVIIYVKAIKKILGIGQWAGSTGDRQHMATYINFRGVRRNIVMYQFLVCQGFLGGSAFGYKDKKRAFKVKPIEYGCCVIGVDIGDKAGL